MQTFLNFVALAAIMIAICVAFFKFAQAVDFFLDLRRETKESLARIEAMLKQPKP